jgi:hypothetical protein
MPCRSPDLRTIVLAALSLASCAESKPAREVENTMTTTAPDQEAEAYVRTYLNGTGTFHHLVMADRLLGRADTRRTLEGAPTLAVDRLAGDYVASRLSPGVQLERKRSLPPPHEGYPAGGTLGGQVQFPSGTVYLVIFNAKLKRRANSDIVDLVPAVALYGDAKAIGAHAVQLTVPAPGDKPCPEYCTSAEQAFDSIRGRLDLIIRKVAKES